MLTIRGGTGHLQDGLKSTYQKVKGHVRSAYKSNRIEALHDWGQQFTFVNTYDRTNGKGGDDGVHDEYDEHDGHWSERATLVAVSRV